MVEKTQGAGQLLSIWRVQFNRWVYRGLAIALTFALAVSVIHMLVLVQQPLSPPQVWAYLGVCVVATGALWRVVFTSQSPSLGGAIGIVLLLLLVGLVDIALLGADGYGEIFLYAALIVAAMFVPPLALRLASVMLTVVLLVSLVLWQTSATLTPAVLPIDRLIEVAVLAVVGVGIVIGGHRMFSVLDQNYTRMRRERETMNAILDTSGTLVIETDTAGRIQQFNVASELLSGFDRQEVLGQYLWQVGAADGQRSLLQAVLEQVGTTYQTQTYDSTWSTRQGATAWLTWKAVPVMGERGEVDAVIHTGLDVTATLQAERERMYLETIRNDLLLAHDIQQNLLPPSRPRWTHPQVVCSMTSSQIIGGDLYAYALLQEAQIGVAVGDVSGKGLAAALLMAASLTAFRSMVGQGLSPSALLSKMDSALAEYTGASRQNCAFVYVELCPPLEEYGGAQSKLLKVANAGGISPIIRRNDGRVEWVDVGGIPLGVSFSIHKDYQEVTLPTHCDEMVILVSDGVVEARNSAGNWLGFDMLEQIIAAGPATDAQAMLDHMKDAVATFIGDAELHDDLTMVVIQV